MRYTLFSVFMTQMFLGILLLLMLFPQDGIAFQVLWVFCSSLVLFYLPGYRVGYLFFGEDDISAFERFMIAFLVSITLLILSAYYLYFTNSSVSSMSIYLIHSVVIFVTICMVLIRWRNGIETIEHAVE